MLNIYQKLVEVRKWVPYLQKENDGNQYKYVSSSQVLANVRVKMDELGLLLIPAITGHKVSDQTQEYYDKDGRVIKRTTTYFTELDMTMTWVNVDNPEEKIQITWYCQGVDIAGEKGVGKALTYGEKYFLLKSLNIATDKDDPDSFQEKHEDKPKQAQQPPVQSPSAPAPSSESTEPLFSKSDMPPGFHEVPYDEKASREFDKKLAEEPMPKCSCGQTITTAIKVYSEKYYGKPLCRDCQAKNKKII
jgi:hypothetical protein